MITIADTVEDIIKRSSFLEEGLANELINLSSLARRIQPEIQDKLVKHVQIGAIVMALKRLSKNLKKQHTPVLPILKKITDITVRSNISEYTFVNTPTIAKKQQQLMQKLDDYPNAFLTITDGVFEVTVFANSLLDKEIENIFRDEKLKNKVSNLSSITLILPEENIFIPGVYYSILKRLAWEGVNFVDVVSSYTELTIMIEEKDIDQAFSILKRITTD